MDAKMTDDKHIRSYLWLWWNVGADLFHSMLDYLSNVSWIWWGTDKKGEKEGEEK